MCLLAGLAFVLLLGWYWQATLGVRAVVVKGHQHADAQELRELSAVDTGAVLYELDPAGVQAQVVKHPWVQQVAVERLPTGTLQLEVTERKPVVLVVGADSQPVYYLDSAGYQMPYEKGYLHAVPLMRGVQAPMRPAAPVENAAVRAFLEAFEQVKAAQTLVSDVRVEDHQITLYTVPNQGQTIAVKLGQGRYGDKLKRLAAFWEQVVRTDSHQFARIDLRFDDQVVVRETRYK